jgi:hypothetical protein
MVEYWKVEDPVFSGIVLKENISLINSPVNPAHGGTNSPSEISRRKPHLIPVQRDKPLSQFPKNHYSIIPLFLPRETSSYFTGANIPIGAKPLSS